MRKFYSYGASYGGATAGLALGYENTDERIDFLILDSPVSSMEWMVEEEMRAMDIGLPISYMTKCGNAINTLKLGFTYADADVAKALRYVKTPVLVINSKIDKVTPYFMGIDIFNEIQADNKEIWTVDDSEHCEMWLDHNQMYMDMMETFLLR